MLIQETSVFTRQVTRILNAEECRLLQLHLVADPEAGDLIPGTGGLRKLRWSGSGRGKRGGSRVIYYWAEKHHTLLLLMLYTKNELDDLTKGQLHQLAELARNEFS